MSSYVNIEKENNEKHDIKSEIVKTHFTLQYESSHHFSLYIFVIIVFSVLFKA